MRRYMGLLLLLLLAACASPFAAPPPPLPSAPSALPTQATASPAATAPPTSLPGATATAPAQAIQASASPAATTQPTPSSAPAAATTADTDELARIAAAAPQPRDALALAEALRGIGKVPPAARTTPLKVKVGDIESFWVADLVTNTNYQISATLRYAGPVVLMYVDTQVAAQVDQAALEQSAKRFEQEIYPRDRMLFGQEAAPGVDGDARLTVLNTPLRGVGGYFSSSAGVVKAANPFSNERDMFVMNVSSRSFGSDGYASTLAHEFQHMIEWNVARRSPLWFNEGMSTLAADLNGFVDDSLPRVYLADPDLQLTTFSQASSDRRTFAAHYGAAQLFLRYFQEQYAGQQGLAELIKTDAGNHLEAFVPIAAQKRADIHTFADIYADWAVANVLDDPSVGDGRFAYSLLPMLVVPHELPPGSSHATVHQFGVDYYGELSGPLNLRFDGATTAALTGVQPPEGHFMWWSNRGDDSVATLTRAFDLSGVQAATLQFSAWYELEQGFDYAFVSVSADGGATWRPLRTSTSTDQDPQGHNYGNGITGVSGAPGQPTEGALRGSWIEEQADLAPFAGKQVLLRFWVVTDDGYNAPGLLLDTIRIPELGYADGAEQGDGGWQAQGFVRSSGTLPQSWELRLIRKSAGDTSVERIPVDAQGHAALTLGAGERGVLAVIATTPYTTEPASYTIALP